MFRRTKSEPVAPEVPVSSPEGNPATAKKDRPTPTRKEAEALARLKAKSAVDPKSASKEVRSMRTEQSRAIRQGIKAGDERYLPARDQGPVKRFVRDYVDARLCIAELSIPLLLASFALSVVNPAIGSGVMNATLLVVVLDSVLLRFRLRRELRSRFPEESLKRTTSYAFMRALQLRFLRLPKPQVKLGQALPARY